MLEIVKVMEMVWQMPFKAIFAMARLVSVYR